MRTEREKEKGERGERRTEDREGGRIRKERGGSKVSDRWAGQGVALGCKLRGREARRIFVCFVVCGFSGNTVESYHINFKNY